MLALTREVGQKILIGDDVVVTVLSVSSNGRVRLGIEAPKHIRVDRQEVLDRVREENLKSADTSEALPSVDAAAWAIYGALRAKMRNNSKDSR